MQNDPTATALAVMSERFGKDMLLALATVENGKPFVRTIDAYYEDGSFYAVTHALSNKIRQIKASPVVAVSGEWFTGHGAGEVLGWICDEKNTRLANKLRNAFAAWFGEGDVDEEDENTVILRIRLTDGVLTADGVWYDIDFTALQAAAR